MNVSAGRRLRGPDTQRGGTERVAGHASELVINDQDCQALRIAVPRRLLSRADEIID
jgi:hypothetical protein